MSRKTKRNQKPERPGHPAQQTSSANRGGARNAIIGAIAVLLIALGAWALLHKGEDSQSSRQVDTQRGSALASAQAPTLGEASAKVHIVEFLDPACETCAEFFPIAKQYLADNPGKIRLSVRHVAFHDGSEYAVRVLEASRKQDKYWQTLEALLRSQHQWAPNHVAQPDLIVAALAGVRPEHRPVVGRHQRSGSDAANRAGPQRRHGAEGDRDTGILRQRSANAELRRTAVADADQRRAGGRLLILPLERA